MTPHRRIVIMGVSGCGKTTVGRALAAELGLRFVDADDHHDPQNVARMAAGIPLTDADRVGWLDRLADILGRHDRIVLACSALRVAYRRRLRDIDGPAPLFVFLDGSPDRMAARMAARDGHFFKGSAMLQSQFATLEPPGPDEALIVNVDDVPAEAVVRLCLDAVRAWSAPDEA